MNDWMRQAKCRGTDPDLFFPRRNEDSSEARSVCAGCPVRLQCEEAGLWEHFGMWGGKSERERRKVRRELHRSA